MLLLCIENRQGWLWAPSGAGLGGIYHFLTHGTHRAACGLELPQGFWEGHEGDNRRTRLHPTLQNRGNNCPKCQQNCLQNQDNG